MNRENAAWTNSHGIDETEIDGNTKYMDNPELFTEAIGKYMSTITMKADVTPSRITHVDPGGLTVQRVVDVEEDAPIDDETDEAVALWTVYQKAVTSHIVQEADGQVVFPEYNGCKECGHAEKTPVTKVSACSECDSSELVTVAVPKQMTLEERIPFDQKHTPVMNDDDLRLAIGPIFDHTL